MRALCSPASSTAPIKDFLKSPRLHVGSCLRMLTNFFPPSARSALPFLRLRCKAQNGEDDEECEKYARYYRSMCPTDWVNKWNEEREAGTWPGRY